MVRRSHRNFETEIKGTNMKIKKYCEGNGFIFADNCNIPYLY